MDQLCQRDLPLQGLGGLNEMELLRCLAQGLAQEQRLGIELEGSVPAAHTVHTSASFPLRRVNHLLMVLVCEQATTELCF